MIIKIKNIMQGKDSKKTVTKMSMYIYMNDRNI